MRKEQVDTSASGLPQFWKSIKFFDFDCDFFYLEKNDKEEGCRFRVKCVKDILNVSIRARSAWAHDS